MDKAQEDELVYVNSVLQKEIEVLQVLIIEVGCNQEKAELIGQINLLKFSQQLLRRCFEYKITPRAIWRKIPMPEHEWSEYRLLEDFDSDKRENWKEIGCIRPSGGDVLIS